MDQIWQVYNAFQSHDYDVRTQAIEHIKTFEQQKGYCYALLEILLNHSAPYAFRQFAGIALKEQIKQHWCSSDEHFKEPEMSEDEKNSIRQRLLFSLGESNVHVRNVIADLLATVAIFDWPEQWEDWIEHMLNFLQDDGLLAGSLYCLHLFLTYEDLSDKQVLPLLNRLEMFKYIFEHLEQYDATIRHQAITVLSVLLDWLAIFRSVYPSQTDALLKSNVKGWFDLFEKELFMRQPYNAVNENGNTSGQGNVEMSLNFWATKSQVMQIMMMLVENFPKQVRKEIGQRLERIIGEFECAFQLLIERFGQITNFENLHLSQESQFCLQILRNNQQEAHDFLMYMSFFLDWLQLAFDCPKIRSLITDKQLERTILWTLNAFTNLEEEYAYENENQFQLSRLYISDSGDMLTGLDKNCAVGFVLDAATYFLQTVARTRRGLRAIQNIGKNQLKNAMDQEDISKVDMVAYAFGKTFHGLNMKDYDSTINKKSFLAYFDLHGYLLQILRIYTSLPPSHILHGLQCIYSVLDFATPSFVDSLYPLLGQVWEWCMNLILLDTLNLSVKLTAGACIAKIGVDTKTRLPDEALAQLVNLADSTLQDRALSLYLECISPWLCSISYLPSLLFGRLISNLIQIWEIYRGNPFISIQVFNCLETSLFYRPTSSELIKAVTNLVSELWNQWTLNRENNIHELATELLINMFRYCSRKSLSLPEICAIIKKMIEYMLQNEDIDFLKLGIHVLKEGVKRAVSDINSERSKMSHFSFEVFLRLGWEMAQDQLDLFLAQNPTPKDVVYVGLKLAQPYSTEFFLIANSMRVVQHFLQIPTLPEVHFSHFGSLIVNLVQLVGTFIDISHLRQIILLLSLRCFYIDSVKIIQSLLFSLVLLFQLFPAIAVDVWSTNAMPNEQSMLEYILEKLTLHLEDWPREHQRYTVCNMLGTLFHYPPVEHILVKVETIDVGIQIQTRSRTRKQGKTWKALSARSRIIQAFLREYSNSREQLDDVRTDEEHESDMSDESWPVSINNSPRHSVNQIGEPREISTDHDEDAVEMEEVCELHGLKNKECKIEEWIKNWILKLGREESYAAQIYFNQLNDNEKNTIEHILKV